PHEFMNHMNHVVYKRQKDEGDNEQYEAKGDQGRSIEVADGFGEFIRYSGRDCRTGRQQRGWNPMRVADHKGDRHGFAEHAPEGEHDGADDADPGVRQDDVAEHLPRGATYPIGGLLEHRRRRLEYVARNRRNERERHDREDQPGGQDADAVGRAGEQGGEDWDVAKAVNERRLQGALKERRKYEQAPDPIDNARDAGQQLNRNADRAA